MTKMCVSPGPSVKCKNGLRKILWMENKLFQLRNRFDFFIYKYMYPLFILDNIENKFFWIGVVRG